MDISDEIKVEMEGMRRQVLGLLVKLDDFLGHERTIPNTDDRYIIKRIRGTYGYNQSALDILRSIGINK